MSVRNELNREHGKELNELALFAGAGGGILGGLLLGWRTVCAVEYDAYARRVLLARQRDGCLLRFPIWDDVRTFDGRPWKGHVDVISGGFPCQDISAAGKGAGVTGERSGLWREMARIIGEVGPRYVLVENSPMLTVRGLGVVLGDLASLGYDARWGVLGAHHAGAPHRRDRIWILANANCQRRTEARGVRLEESAEWTGRCGEDVADAYGSGFKQGDEAMAGGSSKQLDRCRVPFSDPNLPRLQRGIPYGIVDSQGRKESENGRASECDPERGRCGDGEWWATEPDVGRVAHGVASRVDRLRCIGNGQVPAVVKLAWEALK